MKEKQSTGHHYPVPVVEHYLPMKDLITNY